MPKSEEEADKILMKRVQANDPVAIFHIGENKYREGDYEKAFEYWTRAATLGHMVAHYNLSGMYREGQGVEKDLKKQLHHLEEAAIGGHPNARHHLGFIEGGNKRYDRARKHFIIAAKQGDDNALEMVKLGFTKGIMLKEDYEAALRGHQAAVDATKSEQREAAEEFFKQLNQI
jgi:tetratricopeptide (TPR) repeat protein